MSVAKPSLRPARADDCMRVLDWANDPEARRASFHSEPIPEQTHRHWFDAALAGARRLYIVELAGVPAGVARLDAAGPGTAEASLNIAPEHRRRGLAGPVLAELVERAAEAGYGTVVARIRTDNPASRKAFARAGFEPGGRDTVNGIDALVMTIRARTNTRSMTAKENQ